MPIDRGLDTGFDKSARFRVEQEICRRMVRRVDDRVRGCAEKAAESKARKGHAR